MAGPCTRHGLRRTFPPGKEDELARGLLEAPTEGNNTPTSSLAVSQAQSPNSALTPTPSSNKALFQQFIKAYLENQNQNQATPLTPISVEL